MNGFNIKEQLKASFQQTVEEFDLLIIFAVLCHPKSRGSIRIRSSAAEEPPIIDANYMSQSEDIETVLRALKYLLALEQTKAFRKKQAEIVHIPLETCDKFAFKSDNYWRCYIRYFSSTCYHPVGTVKMGPSTDTKACVNPRLQLKGVDNLRIVDASVMPHITSGNTNAPTIMIAEKAVDFIRNDWPDDGTRNSHTLKSLEEL